MQMCKAGAYGPCECATVENEAEAAREEYVRQKGEAATREQMIRAEQEQLLKEREALDAKVRAAKSDAERARWSAELAVLDEQIAKNRAELGGS
jgi:outer membrane murein-binding lipoprotein Lpp